MRTSKFIPFYLAITLHAVPLAYFLLKSPIPQAPIAMSSRPVGIDLSGFSISERASKKTASSSSNSIKTVGQNSNSGNLTTGDGSISSNSPNSSLNPSFMSFTEPVYPVIARQKGYEGKVKIKIFHNQEGAIIKVDIIESSGFKMLDDTVQKTAMGWKLKNVSIGSFEKVFEFKLKN
jgi:TonB family protein